MGNPSLLAAFESTSLSESFMMESASSSLTYIVSFSYMTIYSSSSADYVFMASNNCDDVATGVS